MSSLLLSTPIRMWALGCCIAWFISGQHLHAREPLHPRPVSALQKKWVLVQPMYAPGFRFDAAESIAAGLRREWGSSVPVDSTLRGKGSAAMQWSLSAAPDRPSILVLPEEAVLIGESAQPHPAHISNYEPLLVVGFKRWCAFTDENSPLRSATQLHEWAKAQKRNLRIALPVAAGRMRVWVQGMAHATQRIWEVQVYGINGDFASALTRGADLAIARCDRVGGGHDNVRLLVQSGDSRSSFQPDVPTFKEAGWMPFEHGWTALFAPKSVPADERDRMAKTLYAVVRSPAMDEGLAKGGFITTDLSPAASHEHIASFVKAWELVGHFLLGQSFGDLSEMKGPAVP